MSTSIKGSFHTADGFTVRVTLASVAAADWVVTAGTTYNTVDDLLSDLNADITSTGVSFAVVANATTHDFTVQATTGGLPFSVAWSHAGDGTSVRNFLGETADLSSKATGYSFSEPVASSFYSPYGLRRFDVAAEPWNVQRLMTGAGAVQTNSPHHGKASQLMYTATAEFWYGNSSNYEPFEALRDLIEGLLSYGQPFTISSGDQSYACVFADVEQLTIIPQPVDDVERGDIYAFSLNVVVVE